MDNQFDGNEEDELRHARWEKRIAEMKRQKEKRELLHRRIKKYLVCGGGAFCAVLILGTGIHLSFRNVEAKGTEEKESVTGTEESGTAGMAAAGENSLEGGLEGNPAAGPANGLADGLAADPANGLEGSLADNLADDPADDNEEGANRDSISGTGGEGKDSAGDTALWSGYHAETSQATAAIGEEDVLSAHAILIDASNGTITAQRDARSTIVPASMTKILTVLVAAEHVTDLDDTFTITLKFTDYAYVHDCSAVGFLDGETVTIRDLFYGTVLPSGGDAAVALATYVAGSQEAFVDMMNEKLAELGLSGTAHFTNCVGLYDEEHYCTTYDMAMILKAAVENDLCREVLSAHTYTTSMTEQHPEGITISNWFLRRIEDKDCGGEVLCAKTGFVNQSGSCAASYEIAADGTPYICVTADTYSSWRCIYDHVALYSLYTQ